MSLIVQKFGGSSVANAERVMNVASIVTDTYAKGNDVVVVVSAQGDTTDDLIEKANEINPKASKREKDYAIKRLDGLIRKIETAMEKVVIRITKQLKQPEKKKAVVEEIKKEVKPSIRERLAQNVAKIQREEAERKQLNKGKSCSSDLEL